MRGEEAIACLKAAGFHRVRVDGRHEHWERGIHRIMISRHSKDLDATVEHRVLSLCSGSPTARDLARASQQGKGDLPRDILKPGGRVESLDGRVGTVRFVDYGARSAKVAWDEAPGGEPGASRNTVFPLEDLRLLRGEPAKVEAKREVIPMAGSTPEVGPTGTILDELARLELAAEAELTELVKFSDRVRAYDRLVGHQELLGISIKPLPFHLADGAVPEVMVEPPTAPPTVPTEPPISGSSPLKSRLLALIQAEGGEVTRSRLGQKLGGTHYKAMAGALEGLVARGALVAMTIPSGYGKRTRRVYRLSDAVKEEVVHHNEG